MTQPAVPDLLAVEVPLGGRVLVVSDLHLGPVTTATSTADTVELAQAIDAWAGPGLLIFNGSCLELLCAGGADARAALSAHPALLIAVKAFAAGPGRRVLYLPGARDSRLAWDASAAAALGEMLGAEIALAADLTIDTGAGPRLVRVEPGHQLDALTHLSDPRNPADSPLGHHLVCEVLPALGESFPRRGNGWPASGSGGAGRSGGSAGGPSGPAGGAAGGPSGPAGGSAGGPSGPAGGSGPRPAAASPDPGGWLSGLESLDDPASFPRFLASRLTYRRLGRHAWVLLLPVATAAALRLPFAAVRHAHQHVASASRIALFMVLATAIGLLLVGTVVALLVRGTWRGLAGIALRRASDDDRHDRNSGPRARARELITSGHAGFITGNTRRPELTYLGSGFYANTGCAAKVVTESPARLNSLGVPSLFLAHRQVSWVELEAGSELHVRLLHLRKELAGATVLERLLTRRSLQRVTGDESHPVLVATFPHGSSWPAPVSVDRRLRRVRRWSAALVAAAGVLSLMSAFLAPARQRLSSLLQVVPLAVPQAADALVALASLGLLALARSIRRGQRRAWLIASTLLAGTFILHLVKGFDIEEAVATALVFGYLFVHRDAFRAGVDKPSTRRGLLTLGWGAALTIVAGTAAVELGTRLSTSRHHQRLPLPRAFVATTERLLGLSTVSLPDRLDDFFAPAMVAIAIGLGLAVAYLLSRPVVARHTGTSSGLGRAALASGGGAGAGGGLVKAREIVRRYGSGTLDYFALRPDKEFFFWGESMVAYAVYGGVCLVSPDPIGPRAEREEVWKAFRRFADSRGWTLTVLGAGEDWLPVYRAAGMHDLYVGDEAVVDCTRFTMDGGRFKGLRQAVNRVAKYGYTITFHDPSKIEPALRTLLEGVMTKSRRGDFERGFSMTLGRAFDASDDGLLLAVVWGPPSPAAAAAAGGAAAAAAGAQAAGGVAAAAGVQAAATEAGPNGGGTAGSDGGAGVAEPVAFCQYVPAPGINGYSLDLMRRDNGEHPNGLLDFAIVETIRYLKSEGKRGLGLNFATMRAVLAGEAGDGLSQRVQAWLLRRMSDSMQIESLWKFNAKFDPDWLPRYALYDSPEHALACAIAVARAESFWELPVIGRFLVPSTPATDGTPAAENPAVATRMTPATPAAPQATEASDGPVTAQATSASDLKKPTASRGSRVSESSASAALSVPALSAGAAPGAPAAPDVPAASAATNGHEAIGRDADAAGKQSASRTPGTESAANGAATPVDNAIGRPE